MTEQDEIEIYNEGYRDGLRAALKHEELPTMNTDTCHTCGESMHPNNRPGYRHMPGVDWTKCTLEREPAPIEVTEHPLSDFEHVTL